MEREEPRVGELTRLYLEEAGVKVQLASNAVRPTRAQNGSVLELVRGRLCRQLGRGSGSDDSIGLHYRHAPAATQAFS
nr:hypothetical protein [Arthrobacter sp. ISL-85]